MLSNDEIIRLRFQTNYFVAKEGAKKAYSLATQLMQQRSLAAKESHQIVKLLFYRY